MEMGTSIALPRKARRTPAYGLAGGLALAVLAGPSGAVTNGQQAGSFLLIASGARPASMGEAFTGLADDVTAMSWNPAGLTSLRGLETCLSYTDWFADTSFSNVAIACPIAENHVLGASFNYFHVPRIVNVPEDVEPGVELTNFAAGPYYAWRISGAWSVGGGLKFLSTGVEQTGRPSSSASAPLVDFGAKYTNEDPPISGGVAVQNMGARMRFRDANSPTPVWARAGIAWQAYDDELLSVRFTGDASQPVETGYRLVIPSGGIGQVFQMSLKHPTQTRYNYGIGTEWWLAGILAIRAGWTIRVGSDIDTPSAGAGLRFSVDPFVYSLDYSYSYWSDLSSNISRVSFTISLRPRPRETTE